MYNNVSSFTTIHRSINDSIKIVKLNLCHSVTGNKPNTKFDDVEIYFTVYLATERFILIFLLPDDGKAEEDYFHKKYRLS